MCLFVKKFLIDKRMISLENLLDMYKPFHGFITSKYGEEAGGDVGCLP